MKDVALLIFQKNPLLGKVKTRLAATIGEEKALDIYHQLVELTLKEALKTHFEIFIFYSDFIPVHKPSAMLNYELQKGNDLGERMKNAFRKVFQLGFNKALIIGTDCPEIKAELVTQAAQLLDAKDLVLGPAEDGGYYLLGMKTLQQEIFEQVAWSTESVLKQTLEKAGRKELKVSLLEMLNDIDTAEDLKKFIEKRPEYESIFGYHS